MVAGAVEIPEQWWGRARFSVIADAKTAALQQFVEANVDPGAQVVTDRLSSYPPALSAYEHEPINISATVLPAHESLPAVHRVFSQVKRMIESTYQGAGSTEHLPEYLDEFVFRFNRRKSRHRGLVFLRLLQRAVRGAPVTYRGLVRAPKEKPVHPKEVAGARRKPGSLVGTSKMYPWRNASSDPLL